MGSQSIAQRSRSSTRDARTKSVSDAPARLATLLRPVFAILCERVIQSRSLRPPVRASCQPLVWRTTKSKRRNSVSLRVGISSNNQFGTEVCPLEAERESWRLLRDDFVEDGIIGKVSDETFNCGKVALRSRR